METLIYMVVFNFIVLMIAFKTKMGLYTVSPEKQWKEAHDKFEKNLNALKKIEIDNFKMDTGHMYESE